MLDKKDVRFLEEVTKVNYGMDKLIDNVNRMNIKNSEAGQKRRKL